MVNDNSSSIVIITRELKGSDLIYEQILKSMGITLLQHKVIDVLKDDLQVNRVVELIINNRYDYILFMSSSAVRFITQGIRLIGLEPSIINKASVIAIGPSTRSELLSNGIRVDLMPDRYSSYGLLEMFKAMDCYGKSILIPRSMEASDILAEGLKALGLNVHEEHIYKIVPSIHEGWDKIAEIICSNKVFIIFTSSSIVDTFIRVLRGYMNKHKDIISIMKDHAMCIAIGPLTYEALLRHGLSASVADEHTVSGTFKLLLKLINDNMSNVR